MGNKVSMFFSGLLDSITDDAGHVGLGHEKMREHYGEPNPPEDDLYPNVVRTGLKNIDSTNEPAPQ